MRNPLVLGGRWLAFWLYGSIGGNDWNQTSNFEPFTIRLTSWPNLFAKGKAAGTYASLTNPYNGFTCAGTAAIPFPYPNPTCGAWVVGGNILGASPNFQWPYTYELNFSLQHQFAHGFTLGAAYVGSLSHDLPFDIDLNYPIYNVPGVRPNTANVNMRRPIDNLNLRRQNSLFGQVFQLQLELLPARLLHDSKSFSSVELANNTANPTAARQIPQDYLALREERGSRTGTSATRPWCPSSGSSITTMETSDSSVAC